MKDSASVDYLRAAAALLSDIADRIEAEQLATRLADSEVASPKSLTVSERTWLTESEAAEYSRIAVMTLRNWRTRQNRGEKVPVEAHKFGARVLYHRDELEQAIRSS